MEDISNYRALKENTQNYYGNIGKVFSPALNESIRFSSDGFNHLIFKAPRGEREKPSQILRFKLLPLAVKLTGLSTTYQEIEKTTKPFEVKAYKKLVVKTKPVRYWGIIAIIDGRKIKVILRKVGDNGHIHFWSVIPAWTTNRYRDIRFFSTMKGNPEED